MKRCVAVALLLFPLWGPLSLACGGETEDATTTGTGAAAGNGGDGGGGTGAAGGNGGSGGAPLLHPGVLVDDGLIARYHLDEADSGIAPTLALDAAPNPLDLPITYDNDGITEHMVWGADADGHRGLFYATEGRFGRASTLIDTTKFAAMLQGGTTVTFELVADVDAVVTESSRLIHIGYDTDHNLSFEASYVTHLSLSVNNTGSTIAPIDHAAYGRAVYHGVVDTTVADPFERSIMYVNGTRIPNVVASGLAQDEPINLNTMRSFVIGNREIGVRTIRGAIFYAAIYNVAFTPAQVLQNVELLTVDDDTPR